MYVGKELEQSFSDRLDNILQIIRERNFCNLVDVGVFGSYARHEYKSRSDIDVIVIVEEREPLGSYGYIRELVEMAGGDLTIVDKDTFYNSDSRFMQNVRRDFISYATRLLSHSV